MEKADLRRVGALDAVAFGAPRTEYLEALVGLADEAWVAASGGQVVGYGLAWSDGGPLRTVGPIIAADLEVGQALLAELSERVRGRFRVDVTSEAPELATWATTLGLEREPAMPLMVRNAERPPGRRAWIRALAMPPLG